MEIKKAEQTIYIIRLSEPERNLLLGLMQNPVGNIAQEGEQPNIRKLRYELFEGLK